MSILKINKYNNEVKMSEDYKQVTFSDGKRKTYEKRLPAISKSYQS